MNRYEQLKEQCQFLKKFAEESGVTVFVPTAQRPPHPTGGRPYTIVSDDVVIIDYPDYIRSAD